MSDWISAGVNARLYTRTSSINPLKFSPYWLPPIHNGFVDDWIAPDTAPEATWTQFTYRSNCDPLYVNATCVHDPTGLADGPPT